MTWSVAGMMSNLTDRNAVVNDELGEARQTRAASSGARRIAQKGARKPRRRRRVAEDVAIEVAAARGRLGARSAARQHGRAACRARDRAAFRCASSEREERRGVRGAPLRNVEGEPEQAADSATRPPRSDGFVRAQRCEGEIDHATTNPDTVRGEDRSSE